MTPAVAKAIALLRETERDFLAMTGSLTPEQWQRQSSPGRWPIAGIAEHIAHVERRLAQRVRDACEAPVNPDAETLTAGKENLLEALLLRRDHPAEAPAAVLPTGGAAPGEIVAAFRQERASTLALAESLPPGLENRTLLSPFAVFGHLNPYQWLVYIPLHQMRHHLQMEQEALACGFQLSR